MKCQANTFSGTPEVKFQYILSMKDYRIKKSTREFIKIQTCCSRESRHAVHLSEEDNRGSPCFSRTSVPSPCFSVPAGPALPTVWPLHHHSPHSRPSHLLSLPRTRHTEGATFLGHSSTRGLPMAPLLTPSKPAFLQWPKVPSQP